MKKLCLLLVILMFFMENAFSQNPKIEITANILNSKTKLSEIIGFKGENCPIHTVHLVFVSKEKRDIIEIVNKGNDLEERTLNQMKKMTKGAKIYIEKISSLGDCIEFQFRDPNFIVEVIE